MRITTLSVLAVLLAVGPSDVWAGQQRSVVNEVAVWKSRSR